MWKAYKINERIRIKEIFSLFEEVYANDFEFHGESHNFWECLYVKKGHVCVSADERIYNIGCGGIIFHKPLEFHKFYIDGDDEAELLIFSFSCEGELTGYFENKVFFLDENQKNLIESMIAFCRSKSVEKKKCMSEDNNFKCNYLESIKNDLQMVSLYICQLFLLLAGSESVTEISVSYEAEIFRTAVDYMNSNAGALLKVCDISRYCGISDSGLKRIFNKFAGIGIHKYYVQIKIKAAIRLIESGVSVSETAERLGFSSQGYFSTVFKRETGQSPGVYKS